MMTELLPSIQTTAFKFRESLLELAEENKEADVLWCSYGASRVWTTNLLRELHKTVPKMRLRLLIGMGVFKDCGHGGNWYRIDYSEKDHWKSVATQYGRRMIFNGVNKLWSISDPEPNLEKILKSKLVVLSSCPSCLEIWKDKVKVPRDLAVEFPWVAIRTSQKTHLKAYLWNQNHVITGLFGSRNLGDSEWSDITTKVGGHLAGDLWVEMEKTWKGGVSAGKMFEDLTRPRQASRSAEWLDDHLDYGWGPGEDPH
jgi:hypothetical protein